VNNYPIGVQYDLSLAVISAYCTPCFFVDYNEATTSSDITLCDGPFLFVGAYNRATNLVQLGGFSAVTEIRTVTPINTPHISNGIYWYFTSGYSFGFADSSTINQANADIASDPDAYSRMSWPLDVGYGGYRAGTTLNPTSGKLNKVIYNCPSKEIPLQTLFFINLRSLSTKEYLTCIYSLASSAIVLPNILSIATADLLTVRQPNDCVSYCGSVHTYRTAYYSSF
jgi:hypothetical protein